jgi:hypothetical protein
MPSATSDTTRTAGWTFENSGAITVILQFQFQCQRPCFLSSVTQSSTHMGSLQLGEMQWPLPAGWRQ